MNNYIKNDLDKALQIVTSVIGRCEKMLPKFADGSSQHSLLLNRIKALYIAKSLMLNESTKNKYIKEELIAALPPLSSIISKCEKARQKHMEGTTHYTRFQNMINAMTIAKTKVSVELENR